MASITDQFFVADPSDWVDFDQFLDIPAGDDYSAMASSTSPEMALPYDADMLCRDVPEFMQPVFPDLISHEIPQEGFLAEQSPDMSLVSETTPLFDDAMFDGYHSYEESFQFRQMVEAQAAADQSVASIKEKRREASIALHLQRLCDATALDLDMSSDSNTSFSSPSWSDYMRESISPQPASSSLEHTPAPPPATGNGGFELVLDLNMNTTTNLPKKQKPRSQAQKENYIKARKYGACEKHKKQHKRCNCLEKAAAGGGISNAPVNVAFRDRLQQPSIPVPVLPEMRSSTVPGHDPSQIPSVPRLPANVIKKSSDSSPSHEPSFYQPATQQFTRPTPGAADSNAGLKSQYNVPGVLPVKEVGKNITKSAGYDPQCHESAVRLLVKDPGRGISSIPGHDSSVQTPSRSQTLPGSLQKATVQPTLRWRTCDQSVAGEQSPRMPISDTNCPRQNLSTTNCRDTGTLQKPVLHVRRPRVTESLGGTTKRPVSSLVTPDKENMPLEVRSPGSLVLPGIDRGLRNTTRSSRQPLQIHSARREFSSDQYFASRGKISSGLLGLQTQAICHVAADFAGEFFSSVSTVVSACQPSLDLSSWTENAILKGLSFAGRRLMSAKKGIQLFQGRNWWSN